MRFLSLLIAVAAAHGQTARDPNTVLDQAIERLQEMAHRLEKYVCIETVERSYYQRLAPRHAAAVAEAAPACGPVAAEAADRSPLHLESTDRVHLEVSVSQGRELHSWPGATRFDARDVDELIGDGPVSTGAFGGYLASVFGRKGVSYRYKGKSSANEKTLFEYEYSVPVEASRFEIKVDETWRRAAYEGEFQIDPESLELERLTIRTTELPSGAPFCRAATSLNYQQVHLGDSDLLLPRRSELEIELKSGRETRNVTTFANCREYQAESEIVFDASSSTESSAVSRTERGRVALPIGLPVVLALTDAIDTAAASAGDPVAAKVVKPVRRAGSSEDLIPAGAVVRGHIRRVEHHLLPSPYFLVAIAFNRVEVGGAVSPFFARSEVNAALAKELGVNVTMRGAGIRLWGVGTFLFPSNKSHTVVPAGFESRWFTLATGGGR
jgi:hypothetical protein